MCLAMSKQTCIKAFFTKSAGESNTEPDSISVDDPLIPSDNSQYDSDTDIDTQSDGASGSEPENESECTVTAGAIASDIEETYLYSLISQD